MRTMAGRIRLRRSQWLILSLLIFWLVGTGHAATERVLIGVSNQAAMATSLHAMGGRVMKSYDTINVIVAEIPDGQLPNIRAKHGVRFAESDAPVRKLGSNQMVPWGVEKIGAPIAWQVSRGRGVRVAVLDTGIDATGFDVRVVGGYTALGLTGDYLSDQDGHGTHVAGTLAALDNGFAMVGVAPEVELYSVKVLEDTGSGVVSTLIDGIMWAIQNRIQVVNMSLGTSKDMQALREACQAAYDSGVLLVAAAGNQGKRNGNQDTIDYPAAYPTVVAVGAVDPTDSRLSFSATGPGLDLMAPGVDIVSLLPGNQKGTGSGTSMAAPHVSGTAALVWAANPTWTNGQVKERMLATARPVGDQDMWMVGMGRVDAAAAVGSLQDPAEKGAEMNLHVAVSPTVVVASDVVSITTTAYHQATQAPVQGATVTLSVFTPAGVSFTSTGYTDANGKALFRLRTFRKNGLGAYHVRVQVSKPGFVDGVVVVENACIVQ